MKGKLKKIDNTQIRIQIAALATHNNKINSVETELQALHSSSKKADSDKGAKISEIKTYVQNLAHPLEGRVREQEYALSRTHRMVQEIRVRCEHLETATTSTACITGGNNIQTGESNKSLDVERETGRDSEEFLNRKQEDMIAAYLHSARCKQQSSDNTTEKQKSHQNKEKQNSNKVGQTRERIVHESGERGTRGKRQDDEANVIILDPSPEESTT
ncbi:hypothetical protein Bbelb_049280 [Branchiostoma belcheri]|nr:hypothetical protein Bbelb_049280 [Branchiostoma belcheri]